MNNTSNTVSAFTGSMEQLSKLAFDTFKNAVETSMNTFNQVSGIMNNMAIPGFSTKKKNSGCCPPANECPPRCLLSINKTIYEGERIIVPFAIRNSCGAAKKYFLGMRPLTSEDGEVATRQPQLNKSELDLQPGQSLTVLMTIDTSDSNMTAGHIYSADIVVREKDINQNICFSLAIIGFAPAPEARPLDEKKYTSHFQGWQSHYYCDETSTTRNPNNNNG